MAPLPLVALKPAPLPKHSIFYDLQQDALRKEAEVGAQFNVFASVPNSNFQTAVYVFAVHPQTGVVHFAFGRKVPANTRVPYGWKLKNPTKDPRTAPASALAGAAGTEAKYHGKWASLGGGADKAASSALEAAVIELNDEAAIQPRFDARDHVYVPWAKGGAPPKTSRRLILVSADRPDPTRRFYSFVFKMPNWKEFYSFFPHVNDGSNVRGGQKLVTESHGEIDYSASFTVADIVHYQSKALAEPTPVNFFTEYTLRTLQSHAAPAAEADVRRFGSRGAVVPDTTAVRALPILKDTDPRSAAGWRNPPNMRYV